MITITALKQVPDFAKGQVRDLRPRWALEETGLEYNVRLLESGEQDTADYRSLQPFGQVPLMQHGDLTLFESGAIVLYIAEKSGQLLPKDADDRMLAIQWLFAALNSIEPSQVNFFLADVPFADQDWAKLRRAGAYDFAKHRLNWLSKALGDKPYLVADQFTIADLMMVSILRINAHCDIVTSDENLNAYLKRCTDRPAFQRALKGQYSGFAIAA
jgi:glutathione S-transferase